MTNCRIYFALIAFWATGVALGDPADLSERPDQYYSRAVSVFLQEPEIIEKDGRKYSVLLRDVETEKIQPKLRTRRATGFFFFDDRDYYFVTAQHVANVLSPATSIRFLNELGESRQLLMAKLVTEKQQFVWQHHEQADVSVMKLHLPEKGVKEVAALSLIKADLYTDTPPRTSPLIVAGFPGGLGTLGGKISPITALVHLASDEIRLGSKIDGVTVDHVFLINPPAGKGFSGAPIFYQSSDGKYQCMGILSGAWSDPTGGKFSISTPAKYILDLLKE